MKRWTLSLYSNVYSCTQHYYSCTVKIKKYVEYIEKAKKGTLLLGKWNDPQNPESTWCSRIFTGKVLRHEHLHNKHQPEACCWQPLIFLSEFFWGYSPYVCIGWSPACYNTHLCNRVKQWPQSTSFSTHSQLPSHSIPPFEFISHYPRAPCLAQTAMDVFMLPLSYQIINGASNFIALLYPGLGLWHQRIMIWTGKTWHTGGWTGQEANTKPLRIVCAMAFSKAEAAV